MQRFLIVTGFFTVAAVAFFLGKYPFKGTATSPYKFNVAVIDGNKIKEEAAPFLSVRKLLEEQHQLAHAEILKQENEIRREHELLKGNSLSIDEKKKKKEELDKRIAELERGVQKKKDLLNKQFSLLVEGLEKKMNAVIYEITQKKGIDLVLNTVVQGVRTVLYNDSKLDITNDVITKMNQQIPSVTLPQIERDAK